MPGMKSKHAKRVVKRLQDVDKKKPKPATKFGMVLRERHHSVVCIDAKPLSKMSDEQNECPLRAEPAVVDNVTDSLSLSSSNLDADVLQQERCPDVGSTLKLGSDVAKQEDFPHDTIVLSDVEINAPIEQPVATEQEEDSDIEESTTSQHPPNLESSQSSDDDISLPEDCEDPSGKSDRYAKRRNLSENVQKKPATRLSGLITQFRREYQPRRNYRQHCSQLQSGMQFVKCDRCSNMFPVSCSLMRQIAAIRSSSAAKAYRCKECCRAVVLPVRVTELLGANRNDKPYRCLICNETFSRSGELLHHSKRRCGPRPLQCAECGDTMGSHYLLVMHMKKHASAGFFRCGKCGKAFNELKKLKMHMKDHYPKNQSQHSQSGDESDDSSVLASMSFGDDGAVKMESSVKSEVKSEDFGTFSNHAPYGFVEIRPQFDASNNSSRNLDGGQNSCVSFNSESVSIHECHQEAGGGEEGGSLSAVMSTNGTVCDGAFGTGLSSSISLISNELSSSQMNLESFLISNELTSSQMNLESLISECVGQSIQVFFKVEPDAENETETELPVRESLPESQPVVCPAVVLSTLPH